MLTTPPSSAFAPPELGDDTPLDPADDRTQRHLRMLEELAEIGMDLARAMRRHALAQADAAEAGAAEPTGNDVGLAFSRVARSVRLTMAMEARIAEALDERRERQACERRTVQAREGLAAMLAEDDRLDRRKSQIHRVVERTIETEIEGEDRIDGLIRDLYEKLDDDEAYDDFADRPVGETIARICRDMGLAPDWSRWANEPWAVEEARTQAPGSPYAAPAPETTDSDDGAPFETPPDVQAAAPP